MRYYLLTLNRLARCTAPCESFEYEWFIDGKWQKNKQWSFSLEDAKHDYGYMSFGDYDLLLPELAEELMQKGTIIVHGDIGNGTTFYQPKKIELLQWKKPVEDDNASV